MWYQGVGEGKSWSRWQLVPSQGCWVLGDLYPARSPIRDWDFSYLCPTMTTTPRNKLLQFPRQQISLRFSPSAARGCRECVRAHTRACVYVCTNLLGRIRLGKKPSSGWGRDEQKMGQKQAGEKGSQAAQHSHQVELHLKDTYCGQVLYQAPDLLSANACMNPPPTAGSQQTDIGC